MYTEAHGLELDELWSGDHWKMESIAKAIKKMPDSERPRYLDEVISKLRDNNADVRLRAAVALGMIGDCKAVQPLVGALRDNNADVRLRAAEALGRIRKELSRVPFSTCDFTKAIEALIKALEDEHESVRYVAEEALRKTGPEAEEPLIEALKHEKSYIRGPAAKVLGIIGTDKAIPPLTKLLKDDNPYVRSLAEDALDNIKLSLKISEKTRQKVAESLKAIINKELGR